MLCVTGMYSREITNMIFVIFALECDWFKRLLFSFSFLFFSFFFPLQELRIYPDIQNVLSFASSARMDNYSPSQLCVLYALITN